MGESAKFLRAISAPGPRHGLASLELVADRVRRLLLGAFLKHCLRRRKPSDRNALRRTTYVVEPDAMAELDAGGFAAMLAADPDLEIGALRTSFRRSHLHELAHAVLVDGFE